MNRALDPMALPDLPGAEEHLILNAVHEGYMGFITYRAGITAALRENRALEYGTRGPLYLGAYAYAAQSVVAGKVFSVAVAEAMALHQQGALAQGM